MKKIIITVFSLCVLNSYAQQKQQLTYNPCCSTSDSIKPIERDLGEFEIIGSNENFQLIVKSNNKIYYIDCSECDYDLRKSMAFQLTKKYGAKTASYIIKGDIFVGMNREALLLSWGKALDVNKKVFNGAEITKYTYYSCDVYTKNNKIIHFKTKL